MKNKKSNECDTYNIVKKERSEADWQEKLAIYLKRPSSNLYSTFYSHHSFTQRLQEFAFLETFCKKLRTKKTPKQN